MLRCPGHKPDSNDSMCSPSFTKSCADGRTWSHKWVTASRDWRDPQGSCAEKCKDPDHGGLWELGVLSHHRGLLPLLLSLLFLSTRKPEPLHQEYKDNLVYFPNRIGCWIL